MYRTKVRRWSTVRVSNHTYTVPSRLIGMEVEVRQYADHLEVYYKGRWSSVWIECTAPDPSTRLPNRPTESLSNAKRYVPVEGEIARTYRPLRQEV